MVLVKLLELVGNHIYLQCVNCFLSDNQVFMYQIYCIRSAFWYVYSRWRYGGGEGAE